MNVEIDMIVIIAESLTGHK